MDASPLGRLSAELRNIIYEIVLNVAEDGHPAENEEPYFEGTLSTPAITRVCTQMRNEYLPMFFRSHALDVQVYFNAQSYPKYWSARDAYDLASWLEAIVDHHYPLLRLTISMVFDFQREGEDDYDGPAPWNWEAERDPGSWLYFEQGLKRLAAVLARRGYNPLGKDHDIDLQVWVDSHHDDVKATKWIAEPFKKAGIVLRFPEWCRASEELKRALL